MFTETLNFLLLLLTAYFGLFLHWYKKRVRRQTLSSFANYMLKHYNATKKAVISIFAAVIALYATGDIELSKQTLAIAFGIGYGLDSALNSTPEE